MTYEKDNTDSLEEVENSSADEDADIYSNENCADTTDHVVNLQSTETTTVNTTLNHRFWTEAGWKSAGTLEAGDKLTLADGNTATVTNIAYEDTHAIVYNFEVEDFHTYYVGTESVLVHNNGGNCTKTASALAQGGSKSGSFSKGVGNPVEVVGRGSTGRTVPNTLNEQMAMHQVMSNPLEGAVDMSQLKNHPVIMSDSRWLASEGWVKMSNNVNGVEIHFVYNKITGAFDDFKFK